MGSARCYSNADVDSDPNSHPNADAYEHAYPDSDSNPHANADAREHAGGQARLASDSTTLNGAVGTEDM